jgi:predicted Rossmann-fold nucleotide-binding protein
MSVKSNHDSVGGEENLSRLIDVARRDLEVPHGIFMRNDIHRVVLFLGTSRDCPAFHAYRKPARDLAARIASWSSDQAPARKLWVCSGGKEGIMGEISEGVVSRGGQALGFGYALSGRPPNHHQHEKYTHLFSELGLRGYWLFSRAEAIVAFPGGLGTLMELFDALLHMQVGLRKQVPVFLFGSDFRRKAFDAEALLEQGVVSRHELAQLRYCDDAGEVLESVLVA